MIKATLWIGGAMLCGLALLVGGSYLHAIGTIATAPAQIATKTFNADNIIYNYHWFRQQWQDVNAAVIRQTAAQAALDKFEASAGPRSDWKFQDRQTWDRLSENVTGTAADVAGMKADYNAHAMQADRALFKGSDLPDQL